MATIRLEPGSAANMSTIQRSSFAKRACKRCNSQKRRCDKVMPQCGLCSRLRQKCQYNPRRASPGGPSPSLSPRSDGSLFSVPVTSSTVKDAIVSKLGTVTPEDVFSIYCREIEPWFPIVPIIRLRDRLSSTWDEAPLDVAMLCLCIALLTTTPSSSLESEEDLSEFKSFYLYTKHIMTSVEAFATNSYSMLQSRLFLTFFEVAHGFCPAAFISMGATVRAAEAFQVYPEKNTVHSLAMSDEEQREDKVMTWCGILILDRYIAVESGPQLSLTHFKAEILHDILKPTICPNDHEGAKQSSSKHQFARLLEASSLLDKTHGILNQSETDIARNIEEFMLTIQTINNLEAIVTVEIGDDTHLYSGGLGLSSIALLLAFEHGTKVPPTPDIVENCNFVATLSLFSVISSITSMVEPFALAKQPLDFNLLPPFVTFLAYKAAAVVTERLLMDNDLSEKMRKLKILRTFLNLAKTRWLSCERYLDILNEDTTPRTLKALEERQLL